MVAARSADEAPTACRRTCSPQPPVGRVGLDEEQTSSPPETEMTVRPIPAGMHGLTPHLCGADANGAIDFYQQAFDAVERSRRKDCD
jgi:hypothetical protein